MVEIHDLHVRFHGASREAVSGIQLTIRGRQGVRRVGGRRWSRTVTDLTVSSRILRKNDPAAGGGSVRGGDRPRRRREGVGALPGVCVSYL